MLARIELFFWTIDLLNLRDLTWEGFEPTDRGKAWIALGSILLATNTLFFTTNLSCWAWKSTFVVVVELIVYVSTAALAGFVVANE